MRTGWNAQCDAGSTDDFAAGPGAAAERPTTVSATPTTPNMVLTMLIRGITTISPCPASDRKRKLRRKRGSYRVPSPIVFDCGP